MSPYRKGPAGTAEKLHAEYVRLRAGGICQRCHRPAVLQCAHLIRRSRSATRTDEMNGAGLCAICHFYVDSDPVAMAGFIEGYIGLEAYEQLKAKNAVSRVWHASDWQAETKRLRGLINELKADQCS